MSAITPILTLAGAKRLRESKIPMSRGHTTRGITDRHLARLTDIPLERIKILESLDPHRAEEPWLYEAKRIAGVLGTPSLALLMGVDDLSEVDTGLDIHDPLDVWRTGCQLPLRYGILLGRIFHIEPLALLDVSPVIWELGRTLASGERTSGVCPWCGSSVVGAGHVSACLVGNLYHQRNEPVTALGVPPKPRKPGKRTTGSRMAPGLARLRDRLGITQEQMAASISKHPSYYARLEQMRDPLNLHLAEIICGIYKVSMDELYA